MKILYFLLSVTLIILSSAFNAGAAESYTVKKGDNLYRISKAFGVSTEKIMEANSLESVRLKPGTRLAIPSKKTAAASRKSKSGSTAASTHESGAPENRDTEVASDKAESASDVQYHRVKKGDTLSAISRKYSIPAADLMELNNLKQKARLKPGQTLTVRKTGPKTYTVKKGDTMFQIAKRFDVSVEELVELNELDTIDIKQGQRLMLEERVENAGKADYAMAAISRTGLGDLSELSEMPETEEARALGMKDKVVLFAKKMLNIPYRFGGSTFMGIDCSAYVQKVYNFLNIPLPRTAREQYKVGEVVSREDLSIGDLVFFKTYASFPSHVGIYLGNNLFIHASSKDKMVTINTLDAPYYLKRFIGAKRLLPDKAETEEAKPEGNS